MIRQQAIWFLRRGATVKHISWAEKEYVRLLLGCIVTTTNRVVSWDEFWDAYGSALYSQGWEFSDPFRSMAVAILDDERDEFAIYRVMADLRAQACAELYNGKVPVGDIFASTRIWHGTKDFCTLVDSADQPYMPGYVFSGACVQAFIEKLVSHEIIRDATELKTVPYTR